MNNEIGIFRRDELIDSMNAQTAAIKENSASTRASIERAGELSAQTIASAEAAATRVVDRTGSWTAGTIAGAIILWHLGSWLKSKFA